MAKQPFTPEPPAAPVVEEKRTADGIQVIRSSVNGKKSFLVKPAGRTEENLKLQPAVVTNCHDEADAKQAFYVKRGCGEDTARHPTTCEPHDHPAQG